MFIQYSILFMVYIRETISCARHQVIYRKLSIPGIQLTPKNFHSTPGKRMIFQTSLHEYRKKKFYFVPIKGLKQNSRFSFFIFDENDFVAAKSSR